jgi:hypothetical protein
VSQGDSCETIPLRIRQEHDMGKRLRDRCHYSSDHFRRVFALKAQKDNTPELQGLGIAGIDV